MHLVPGSLRHFPKMDTCFSGIVLCQTVTSKFNVINHRSESAEWSSNDFGVEEAPGNTPLEGLIIADTEPFHCFPLIRIQLIPLIELSRKQIRLGIFRFGRIESFIKICFEGEWNFRYSPIENEANKRRTASTHKTKYSSKRFSVKNNAILS